MMGESSIGEYVVSMKRGVGDGVGNGDLGSRRDPGDGVWFG
jgi:hypothetical protein